MVLPDAKPSGAVFYCFFNFQYDIPIALPADFCVIAALYDSLDDLGSLLADQAII